MAKRYMHVTDALRRSIADQIGGFLFGTTETGTETNRDEEG